MGWDLEDKVAIVTGAGSGIGRASALALVEAGARVAVVDIDEAAGRETVELAGGDSRAIAIVADVSVQAENERMVSETVEAFGRLDIAHNNAGVELAGLKVTETSLEQWDRVMSVNLTGVWLGMRAEIPALAKAGGSIINTASALGLAAIPNQSAYIAAKHGVVGLTRAAAIEFSSSGVRVNALCPGVIRTALFAMVLEEDPAIGAYLETLHPIGRFGEPREVADAVLWLGSEHSSFVTGAAIPVDGGYLAA